MKTVRVDFGWQFFGLTCNPMAAKDNTFINY